MAGALVGPPPRSFHHLDPGVPMSAPSRSYVLDAWKADRARYPKLAFIFERSIWAVGVLRFGQWVDTIDGRAPRLAGRVAYQLLFVLSETLTGISMPKSVIVGPG